MPTVQHPPPLRHRCPFPQVASEERLRLEAQVDSLSTKLAGKEARLRNSVDALAKASYKLRASFTAEVRHTRRGVRGVGGGHSGVG